MLRSKMEKQDKYDLAMRVAYVRSTAVALTDCMNDLKEIYGADMYREIIDYIKEKEETN